MEKCKGNGSRGKGTPGSTGFVDLDDLCYNDPMKLIIPSEEESFDSTNPFTGLDITLFFQKELRDLMNKYGYSEEDYRLFLSWHQPKVLVDKIIDPNRYFRILRKSG